METADTFSRHEHRNTAGRVAYQVKNRQILAPHINAKGYLEFQLGIDFLPWQPGYEGLTGIAHIGDAILESTVISLDEPPPDAHGDESNLPTWFRSPFDFLWLDLCYCSTSLLIMDRREHQEGAREEFGLDDPRIITYVFSHQYEPGERKRIGTRWISALRAVFLTGFVEGVAATALTEDLGGMTFPIERVKPLIDEVFLHIRDTFFLINVVSNVKLEKVPPANRVPKHERRYPKLDYHIITVGKHGRGAVSPRLVEQLRQSPRQHLRRGHLRHLSTGSVAWVRPCIVGDAEKGMIVHDYQTA